MSKCRTVDEDTFPVNSRSQEDKEGRNTLLCFVKEELDKSLLYARNKFITLYCIVLDESEKLLLHAWNKDIVLSWGVMLPATTNVRLDVCSIVWLSCLYWVPHPIVWNGVLYCTGLVNCAIMFQVMFLIVATCCMSSEWFCAGKCSLCICHNEEFTLYINSLDVRV